MNDRPEKAITDLNKAINQEHEFLEYLMKQSKQVSSRFRLAVIKPIITEIESHIDILQKIHARIIEAGSWPSQRNIEAVESSKPVFGDVEETLQHGYKLSELEHNTLKKMLELCSKAMGLYDKLASSAKSEQEISFYNWLSSEKQRHYVFIDNYCSILPGS